jgi:hypothetical protein
MPEFALATRTSTARAAAIAVIAAAVAPGAAAFGASSALQLRSMSVALPRSALSASRPCMAAAGGDPAPTQEPRLLGSRRLHRWLKGENKTAAALQIKDDILASAANSQEIFRASMLLGASLTRTRIHEVAMGMSLGGISKELGGQSLDHASLVEETLRKTGLPVVCAEVNDDGGCTVWASEEHVESPIPFLSMALGSSKMLEDHLAGVPDVTDLDGGKDVRILVRPSAKDAGAPAEAPATPAEVPARA